MHTLSPKLLRAVTAVGLFLATVALVSRAQSDANKSFATVEGYVRDSSNHTISGATVILESAEPRSFKATTDPQGHFRFDPIASGTYKLRAKAPGREEGEEVQFVLQPNETKSVVLFLVNERASGAKDASAAIEFSDEARFTVAGVTDASALGGHGSDRAVRNSEALSKEAVALAREKPNSSDAARTISAPAIPPTEAALRASLAQKESAEAHLQLAEIEEGSGRPLEAVKDYQRAAELQPSEPHLFAWGAELLQHHAPGPATEVFAKGHRLYSRSVRMALGLAAAQYAQGFKEDAAKMALDASDLDPSDPAPYLFLGRIQDIENSAPPGWVERIERFVDLHPENAMAHYLYAVALARSGGEQQRVAAVEAQLATAIKLDPGLGNAYLQLGIVRSQRNDDAGAILAFQKAIETTPLPDEAHYRLAAIYRRKGEREKAAKETELFKQCSEQKRQDAERERHEIQQFVYTLRGQNTSSQAPPTIPAPR